MADPVVSPTGIAVVQQWLVRVAVGLVGLAATLIALAQAGVPIPSQLLAVATTVVALGAAFGIVSQGLRVDPKPAQDAGLKAAADPGPTLNK